MTTAPTTTTLIRHGFAMPPSPWKGEGFRRAILAFPTQGGRCPEGADEGDHGGAYVVERADTEVGPYGVSRWLL